jgi:uncharacterized protein (DUF427 family)
LHPLAPALRSLNMMGFVKGMVVHSRASKRLADGIGRESVWDYPRPPALEPAPQQVRVIFAGRIIAASSRAYRVLETSHPPVYYMPPEDVALDCLFPESDSSFCEFKGEAIYWMIRVAKRTSRRAAWSYPNPDRRYAAIRNHFAFYASRVDECWVGEERAAPQEGDFYGGWITSRISGPFKGGPGTLGW